MRIRATMAASLVAISTILSSCQTPQESAMNAEMTCQSQGFRPGTQRYNRCVGATYQSNRAQAQQAETVLLPWPPPASSAAFSSAPLSAIIIITAAITAGLIIAGATAAGKRGFYLHFSTLRRLTLTGFRFRPTNLQSGSRRLQRFSVGRR